MKQSNETINDKMNLVMGRRTPEQAEAIRNSLNFMLNTNENRFAMGIDLEISANGPTECNTVCCVAGSIVVANLTTQELEKHLDGSGDDQKTITKAAAIIGVGRALAKELFLPNNQWACWQAKMKDSDIFVTQRKAVRMFWIFYKTGHIVWSPEMLAKYELKYPTPAPYTHCETL